MSSKTGLTPSMWVATAAIVLLIAGYFYRRSNRARHVGFMLAGIALDVSLVVYLQIQRNAVQKALEFSMSPWQQGHILVSTAALSLYFPTVLLGTWLYRRPGFSPRLKTTHVRIATLALILRLIGFLLMFSLLDRS